MATGMAPALVNEILDAIGNNSAVSIQPVTTCYIQLHTADPGAAGTTAVATESTRQSISFGAAAGGAIANDTAVTWTSVAGSEDYTHFSLWDASSNGNFLWSGTVTANAVTTGDNFEIPVGDLDLDISVAS